MPLFEVELEEDTIGASRVIGKEVGHEVQLPRENKKECRK